MDPEVGEPDICDDMPEDISAGPDDIPDDLADDIPDVSDMAEDIPDDTSDIADIAEEDISDVALDELDELGDELVEPEPLLEPQAVKASADAAATAIRDMVRERSTCSPSTGVGTGRPVGSARPTGVVRRMRTSGRYRRPAPRGRANEWRNQIVSSGSAPWVAVRHVTAR